MKFKGSRITEATEKELRALWLNDESLNEIMSFEDYLEKMKNSGTKIKEEKKK